ncbi:MAG: hypothetical protein U1F68_11805 [Gammaproteobacteria bacterium]
MRNRGIWRCIGVGFLSLLVTVLALADEVFTIDGVDYRIETPILPLEPPKGVIPGKNNVDEPRQSDLAVMEEPIPSARFDKAQGFAGEVEPNGTSATAGHVREHEYRD